MIHSTSLNDAPQRRTGKSASLEIMRDLNNGVPPPFIILDTTEDTDEKLLTQIDLFLQGHPTIKTFVVRSDKEGEDGTKASFAGAYRTDHSIPRDRTAILAAVKLIHDDAMGKHEALQGYAEARGVDHNGSFRVILQEMIEKPEASGAIFSHDASKDDGYLLINFHEHDHGEDIASGRKNGRVLRVLRGMDIDPNTLNRYPFLDQLVEAQREVETLFENRHMDCEFAFKNGQLYMLQARPLTSVHENPVLNERQSRVFVRYARIVRRALHQTISNGDRLGNMPDINPRELLGHHPLPLNVSVYRDMFADRIVEEGRKEMGYDPAMKGMVRDVAGEPYISVATAAHSFRPATANPSTMDDLETEYLRLLDANPTLQDKVEFDLFFTAMSPEVQEKLRAMPFMNDTKIAQLSEAFQTLEKELGIKADEFMQLLDSEGSGSPTIESPLLQRYRSRLELLTKESSIRKIRGALREGTRIFVAIGRLAFFAKARLAEQFPPNESDRLLGYIQTPSGYLQASVVDYARGRKTEDDLQKGFGHLRANQFNIFSAPYADDIHAALRLDTVDADALEQALHEQDASRAALLAEIDAMDDADRQTVVRRARFFMEARELMKFEFMRAYMLLSEALKERAARFHIPVEILSQATLREVQILCGEIDDRTSVTREQLLSNLLRRVEHAPIRHALRLPDVITPDSADISVIETLANEATYITDNEVQADICYVTDETMNDLTRADVSGKILFCNTADPGYDHLLTMGIAGIVTEFGGPASHMVLRALEMNLPAAIGVGSEFDALSKAKRVKLHCGKKSISISDDEQ